MKPKKPCPWCDGTSFGVVERVRVHMHSSAKKGFGNEIQSGFTMVICQGCGATQLFGNATELLDDLKHQVVDVNGGA